MSEKAMSILEHLEDLRRVLLVSIISLIPATVVGWFYKEPLLAILMAPVNALDQKLVYIAMTEAFMAQLKISFIAGFILASPIIFWQVWSFVLPALQTHEKRYLLILVPLSILLFAGGVIFAYSTVFKYGIKFFLGFATDGLTPMLSLSKYLTFIFWFLLPFGLMFELPLVMYFLAKIGLVNYRFLAQNRKFALLIIFVIAAVATPTTDLISQAAMAVPMYILYELSIWIVRFVKPRASLHEESEAEGSTFPEEPDKPEAEAAATEAGEAAAEDDAAATEAEAAATEDEAGQPAVAEAGNEQPVDREQRLEDIYRNITERGNPDKK